MYGIAARKCYPTQSERCESRTIEPRGIPDLDAQARRGEHDAAHVLASTECAQQRAGIAAPQRALRLCGNRPARELWRSG